MRRKAFAMEQCMVSIHVDIEKLEWTPGSAKYGPAVIHDGKENFRQKSSATGARKVAVLLCCRRFHRRRESLSKLLRSRAPTSMSSTFKAAAAQSPDSRCAPPPTTRSTRKARCTAL